MTPADLFGSAQAVLQAGGERLTLYVPAGAHLPASFPRGELLCVPSDGGRTYSARAQRVVDWLRANRLA